VPLQRNDTGINPIIANVYTMSKLRQNLLLDIPSDGFLLADIIFERFLKDTLVLVLDKLVGGHCA